MGSTCMGQRRENTMEIKKKKQNKNLDIQKYEIHKLQKANKITTTKTNKNNNNNKQTKQKTQNKQTKTRGNKEMNKRIWNVIKQNESEPTKTDLRVAKQSR